MFLSPFLHSFLSSNSLPRLLVAVGIYVSCCQVGSGFSFQVLDFGFLVAMMVADFAMKWWFFGFYYCQCGQKIDYFNIMECKIKKKKNRCRACCKSGHEKQINWLFDKAKCFPFFLCYFIFLKKNYQCISLVITSA